MEGEGNYFKACTLERVAFGGGCQFEKWRLCNSQHNPIDGFHSSMSRVETMPKYPVPDLPPLAHTSRECGTFYEVRFQVRFGGVWGCRALKAGEWILHGQGLQGLMAPAPPVPRGLGLFPSVD
ncbi:hypothetical protein PCH_Pc21g15550 [Penicillium rubens Wisconsin 54-1255]|uniref:Uncharacterized protein n=1 Tax=Penicillium rubens (strain ATCC 28089 / DSM 1075 / NRRL 1951 / Wisconsin 54-1255) TaxID=500485 RepID=B6HJV3_PENRW|nr:hypothetical protein PCH_Pc21g15550 [Penicillium rubens Wisconsin 54-1255]